MEGLLDNLNKEQLEAVKAVEGPVMVFAGAGTGKTRALTARIAYMIKEKNIMPYNILAITFTKKATNEMRERVAKIVGDGAKYINISTIHALCAKILRRGIEVLGYKKDFEIIDDEDALKIINEVYKDENIDRKYFAPKSALNLIGSYKINNSMKLFALQEKVYNSYQKYLKEHNLVDFEDLLVLTKEVLLKDQKYLKFLQDKYQYILVDEFQDTNPIQYDIVKMLAGEKENLFVVGDDDQSIYSFTGATVDNMYLFLDDYPKSQKIILDQNYRSSNAILKGANSVIAHNNNREKKSLKGQTEGSYKDVIINEAYYFEDEARYVAGEIKSLIKKGYDYQDIAVVYRNNVISRNFELAFIENKIPYSIYGGTSYLKRREIKDIVSYLKYIVDSNNITHFKRVINQPARGIGEKTIVKVLDTMAINNCTLFEAIDNVHNSSPSTKTNALVEFKNMIVDFQEKINTLPLQEFYDYLLDKTGYLEMAKVEDENNETNRVGNLQEFKSILLRVEVNFLDEELTNVEKLKRSFDEIILDESLGDSDNKKGVVLSTIHSVKGLEFKVVFVTALEEGIFPALREESDVDEERRVAYVAFTRAKEKIYLTCATRRLIYGRVVKNPKSRFLTEYLENPELEEHLKVEKKKSSEDLGEIHVGEHLYHSNFGAGIVISVDDLTAQILFEKDNSLRKILKNHPAIIRGNEE
ncbi:MAG: UvrD-helicase domain-containing protein [Bacilli bacterium]|nr:UvrD-helicase domain-containing protein [Bacilli bacterium]